MGDALCQADRSNDCGAQEHGRAGDLGWSAGHSRPQVDRRYELSRYELYRARAERAGIVYVDIWDGFVDDQGRYTLQGPDFEGQIRRLRSADGVHFTKAGAVTII